MWPSTRRRLARCGGAELGVCDEAGFIWNHVLSLQHLFNISIQNQWDLCTLFFALRLVGTAQGNKHM